MSINCEICQDNYFRLVNNLITSHVESCHNSYFYMQKFPGDLLPSTFPDPDNPGTVKGRTEIERRQKYVDLLELGILCSNHPNLIQLVKQCLHNAPNERPNTDELLSALQGMKVEVEGDYGGPFGLDMVRVRLAKEVKAKERRTEELTQEKVVFMTSSSHYDYFCKIS